MRVLFLNRVYPPVPGATGELLRELAHELVADGWEVTVLTCGIPDKSLSWELVEGVHVVRLNSPPLQRGSKYRRAYSYLMLYPRMLVAALRLPRPDVIVVKTDPPLHLLLGPLLKRFKHTPVVHWAQDMYPEVAEALGVVTADGKLANTLRYLSSWALKRYDHVVAIGRCMRERLVRRGVPEGRISVVPNWSMAYVQPVPMAQNTFRREHAAPERFVVMYSGNMGLAHPFRDILEAAALLRRDGAPVDFLFVGDGPRRAWIERQVQEQGLTNVRFLPFQPPSRLAESLSAADLHLVSMEQGIEGYVVPSKVYGVMAAGRPCIFIGPAGSEAAQVVEEHQCGTVLERPSPEALAAAIAWWAEQAEERLAANRKAQAFARASRRASLQSFKDILRTVADRRTCVVREAEPVMEAV